MAPLGSMHSCILVRVTCCAGSCSTSCPSAVIVIAPSRNCAYFVRWRRFHCRPRIALVVQHTHLAYRQRVGKYVLKKFGRTDLENLHCDKPMGDAREKVQEDAQRKLRDSARYLNCIICATRVVEQPIPQKLFTQAKVIFEQEKLKAAKEAYGFGLKANTHLATALLRT
ncbi:hypothetical protein Gpo141_00011475 [Globisporangium polare]